MDRWRWGDRMRWVIRILKWLGYGLAGLCVLGFAYQVTGNILDEKYAPPASEMTTVDGQAVHFSCTGSGPRTYLLDSGAGVGAFEWEFLVPELAKAGRVCSFDRPGLGWSDDTGEPHDVTTLVRRIAAIVRAARVPMPFVYVGHSLGANNAMVYRNLYPHDVAALVLIEPGRPKDLLEDFHGGRAEAMAVTDCGFTCYALEAASWLGVSRLGAQIAGAGGHSLSPRMRAEYLAELSHPAQVKTIIATLYSLPKSAYEIEDVKSFGDTPVLVLTSSDPRKRDSDETEAQFRQWRADQLAYFESVAHMSSRGKGPIVIPNSTHATMVMSSAGASAVARAIADFGP